LTATTTQKAEVTVAMKPSPPIAEVIFTDGRERPVYEGADGRQYVLDDGEPVYGVWFIPRDEADTPVVVDDAPF
jgi:hypothetical protein